MNRIGLLIAPVTAGLVLLSGSASSAQPTLSVEQAGSQTTASRPTAGAKAATKQFHSIAVAEQHGYALLTDAKGIACIDMPGMGGMGVHWANGALVGDKLIDARRPEALVYAPDRNGTLRLAALEYVVLKADWDASHARPPALFGHTFDTTAAPNRFGLPAYYSLHAWLWKPNPAGTFTPWNPRVTCPPA